MRTFDRCVLILVALMVAAVILVPMLSPELRRQIVAAMQPWMEAGR